MRTLVLATLIFVFTYPFLVFPVLLRVWAKRKRRSVEPTRPEDWPRVALLICALNEQGIIRDKIENSLALRYPGGKLSILVVSDGSTDRTAEIVLEFQSAGVTLLDHKTRRGKVANLNEVIPTRDEQIIVLSDANVLYHHDAVTKLIARFSDSSVGCVSGKVILTDTTPDLHGPTGEYYSVEWALQENSSIIYSMAGADGAMYGLRRELFRPCPNDTLIEDFVIPMQVIAQGKRVVLEPSAVGWEKGVESRREEFRRKVRIAAGAAQGLLRGNAWPQNAPISFWFIFISHKLLRWLSPFVGAVLLLSAAIYFEEQIAKLVLLGMSAIAVLALAGWLTKSRSLLLSAPLYFLLGEIAIAIGFLKGLAGLQTVLWAKENR